jgi:arylsulfatase A-like enzyme
VWRRSAALLAAFVSAKIVLVALRLLDGGGRTLGSLFSVPAFLFQDVIVVTVFAAVDAGLLLALRSRVRATALVSRTSDVFVLALSVYAAFNVAVARLFSTPLTHSMLNAAGGALADSIFEYVTPSNVIAIAIVVGVALLAFRSVARLPNRAIAGSTGVVAAAVVLVGPGAARRVDTLGMHRNALVAVISTTWSARRPPPVARADVEVLAPLGRALDLSHLEGAARGRSVIWVILESTAARYLGSYGADPDATPRLTQLAQDGLIFEHAYCAQPESIKGLFSMLCSRSPAPGTAAEDYTQARLACPSIAARLRNEGYRTALFHSGRFRYLGMQGVVDERGFDELHDAGTIGGEHVSSFGTADASTVDGMLRFLDAVKPGGRFFLVYSPISGHHPYRSPGTGPRPFPAQTEQEQYRNDLYAGDHALGTLIDGVRARGLGDRVLWAIVGDHGQAFGEHEGNFAHTLFLYEENVHVPMIFVAPGALVGRMRAPQITSLIDLAPATLALLGLGIPAEMRGRSPLLPQPGVARFFTDHGPVKLALRQGNFKFIYESEHERARLFDLTRDPEERSDLSASFPALTATYTRHLLTWQTQSRRHILTPAPR